MKKIKLLILYSLPFIAAILLNCFNIKTLTEITGNTNYSFLVTSTFLVYYLIVITLTNTWKTSPIAILIILIFGIAFLPVRKNISTINYIAQGDTIYWIERHIMSGEIVVYSGKTQLFIRPTQVHIIDEITHTAYLNFNSDNNLILVYSKSTSPEKYQHSVILNN